ncbi:hypothetical protein BDZ89DRAFT_1071880 [Hymenopellis radicata]|nr:hypothetical protein BDZ89DRAFT_1071880 [Hymenopellis radicata]
MASPRRRLLPSFPEDPTHPAQVALRTYGLAVSLSLAPAVTPLLTSVLTSNKSTKTHLKAHKRLLKRELGLGGFAFAVTLAVGGGSTLRSLWNALDQLPPPSDHEQPYTRVLRRLQRLLASFDLTATQKTFISYCLTSSVGIFLLQSGRHRSIFSRPKPSRTLDLTLLLFVRALDAVVQSFVFHRSSRVRDQSTKSHHTALPPDALRQRLLKEKHEIAQKKNRDALTTRIDGLVFWACSARIMWCFFYEPTQLPRSYVRWIGALADVDPRLLRTLQLIRGKNWSYVNGSANHLSILEDYAVELGIANEAWATLGVSSRPKVGGLPCELVHGGMGSTLGLAHSCTANSSLRALRALVQSILIYLPVHFIPTFLTRPKLLLRPHRILRTLLGSLRSASFLSAFITSYWYTVCLTRSLVSARLFPSISHDFWDGPYGCILAGCMACGSSIWIENPRRRGEMAMYVIPRALRTLLPESFIRSRSIIALERLVFTLSLSSLVTAMIHRPDSLRGLSRWALAFVINGPNAGFWQKRRSFDPSIPVTPSIPPTPALRDTNDTQTTSVQ